MSPPEINEEYVLLGSTPISDTAPTGEDIRYEQAYEELESEIGKLESLSGETVNWAQVVIDSKVILKEQSKDLNIACFLVRGLYEKEGYSGLANGFALLQSMINTYWETLHPPVKRARARAGAINWLAGQLQAPVEKQKPGPSAAKIVKTCFEIMKQTEDKLDELMGDQAPNIIDFRKKIKSYVDEIEREEKTKAAEAARKANAEAKQQQQSASDTTTAQPVSTEQAPANVPTAPAVGGGNSTFSSSVASDDDVSKSAKPCQDPLRQIAIYLRNKKLSDPLPYSLFRISTWIIVTQIPPATNGITQLREVPPDKVNAYKAMLEAGNFIALIPEVENSFSKAPFWLDAHRIVAAALEGLGAGYEAARRSVIDETAMFLHRFPGVLDLQFSNGTPFADDLTRLWVESEVMSTGAEGSDGKGGQNATPWAISAKNAQVLAGKGKFDDGITLLQEGMKSTGSRREQTFWELELARFCAKAGHYAVALSQLEHLDEQVVNLGLEEWESELSLEIARVYVMCHDKLLAKKNSRSDEEIANAARLRKRICRLDVIAALSLTKH
ncbi:MAG: type VI secretion system protein TssA [Gammaproteobacteria bacterium]|nr:type VI secretion system protein TssA [Gammaproteobacteria bacterium]